MTEKEKVELAAEKSFIESLLADDDRYLRELNDAEIKLRDEFYKLGLRHNFLVARLDNLREKLA